MKRILKQLTRFHRPGELPNVSIFSSARSGSSWLMELIATQPGFLYVDEPLHPNNLIACKIAKPPIADAWNILLPNENRRTLLERYFLAIEKNRIQIGLPSWSSGFYRFRTSRVVYKILRAKDLMEWFADRFGWQMIYLIRHPLAVNVSRKSVPRLELFLKNNEFISRYLTDDQYEFSCRIKNHGTELQRCVLDWCCQNLPAINICKQRNWLAVHYEDLVCNPDEEIQRLARALDLPNPERMLRRIAKASGSVVQSDNITRSAFESTESGPTSDFLLTKWRSKLELHDEEYAFEVLDAFDIDFYQRGLDKPVRRISKPNEVCRHDVGNKKKSQ